MKFTYTKENVSQDPQIFIRKVHDFFYHKIIIKIKTGFRLVITHPNAFINDPQRAIDRYLRQYLQLTFTSTDERRYSV